jgi:hypothetical protein
MAQRDAGDIKKALLQKGFYSENSDHTFFYYEDNQNIFTKISHGSKYKSYGDDLLGKMSRQLKITKSELLKFIDCPLRKEDYLIILRAKGLIDP